MLKLFDDLDWKQVEYGCKVFPDIKSIIDLMTSGNKLRHVDSGQLLLFFAIGPQIMCDMHDKDDSRNSSTSSNIPIFNHFESCRIPFSCLRNQFLLLILFQAHHFSVEVTVI